MTGQFKVVGEVGTKFSFSGTPDEINNVDCGAWTKIIDGPYSNWYACKRGEDDYWESTVNAHKVLQCGGFGCIPASFYNYYLEPDYENVPKYFMNEGATTFPLIDF